jgi:hypothetical protein
MHIARLLGVLLPFEQMFGYPLPIRAQGPIAKSPDIPSLSGSTIPQMPSLCRRWVSVPSGPITMIDERSKTWLKNSLINNLRSRVQIAPKP